MKCKIVLFLLVGFAVSVFAQEKTTEKFTMKPALIVIDVQSAYMKYTDDFDKKFGPEMINAAIHEFRKNGFPVYRVYHSDPQWGPPEDSEGFAFDKSIIVKESDKKIIKHYASSFKKTELDKTLKEDGRNTLFLCGLSAVGCVLATYRSADDLDYKVFMVKDAIMSHKEEYTDMIEDITDAVTYQTLKTMLEMAK